MEGIETVLSSRSYPGHGILLGHAPGKRWVQSVRVYFVTGEDKCILQESGTDCLCTTLSGEMLYAPVRTERAFTVISNGIQSDVIQDSLKQGKSISEALHFCDSREHWDLRPGLFHNTPRISGVMQRNGNFSLSISKCENPNTISSHFFYEYPWAAISYFLSTFQGDGSAARFYRGPAPFYGEPVPVVIEAPSASILAEQIWESLAPDIRVSLFVRYIDQRNGFPETVIINRFGKCSYSAPKTPIWPTRRNRK